VCVTSGRLILEDSYWKSLILEDVRFGIGGWKKKKRMEADVGCVIGGLMQTSDERSDLSDVLFRGNMENKSS